MGQGIYCFCFLKLIQGFIDLLKQVFFFKVSSELKIKYENLVQIDKNRYEQEMLKYKAIHA